MCYEQKTNKVQTSDNQYPIFLTDTQSLFTEINNNKIFEYNKHFPLTETKLRPRHLIFVLQIGNISKHPKFENHCFVENNVLE